MDKTEEHPILLLCKVIPEEYELITGELLDKIHLVLSATKIYHAKNRDEINHILTNFLVELNLVQTLGNNLKQTPLAKEIIQHYG